MSEGSLVRGRVVWFVLGDAGRRPAVVVSNNARNRALGPALVVRVTTSPKPALPSIVELGPEEPLVGRVLCDDVIEVDDDEVLDDGGALTSSTMRSVELGLRHALGMGA